MFLNENDILTKVKSVHLIGIGGIGMSGIAEYLLLKGMNISGSDITKSHITTRLEKLGAKIIYHHNKENITDKIDLIIYTSAVKKDNEEYLEANKKGIPLIRRAEMLGLIVNDKKLISVSGTHGKTTTTAMIAKIMIDNDLNPTVFVGGNLDFLEGGSSRIGNSDFAVVEADEYDRSFLTLKSNQAVITNIELDHTDIYKDLPDIKNNFEKFCSNSKPGCQFIGFGDDTNTREVLQSNYSKSQFYGFEPSNQYKIKKIIPEIQRTRFEINNEINILLNVNGNHNILNATAAYIVCKNLGIEPDEIKKSLENFNGVQRRLQLKYKNEIKVYDDYAHHPTEIISSFNALKNNSDGRIITVFQPHLYSRTKQFYKEFASALSGNDITFLLKIYPAREKEIEGVTSELIFNEFKKNSDKEIFLSNDFESVINKLNTIIKQNDIVVFQGAGDVTNLCEQFINNLKNQ